MVIDYPAFYQVHHWSFFSFSFKMLGISTSTIDEHVEVKFLGRKTNEKVSALWLNRVVLELVSIRKRTAFFVFIFSSLPAIRGIVNPLSAAWSKTAQGVTHRSIRFYSCQKKKHLHKYGPKEQRRLRAKISDPLCHMTAWNLPRFSNHEPPRNRGEINLILLFKSKLWLL